MTIFQHRGGLTLLMTITLGWSSAAQPDRSAVRLKYLGTAGWEISDGRSVVLIDPYLSRLRRVTPNDTFDPADTRPLFDNGAIAQSDRRIIDADIQRSDFVLSTHTHYDHALDAPYIASRTGATIIGTESSYNFARAHGVPATKLIVVRGGEDYAFEGLSVRVIPSLHGVLRRAEIVSRIRTRRYHRRSSQAMQNLHSGWGICSSKAEQSRTWSGSEGDRFSRLAR